MEARWATVAVAAAVVVTFLSASVPYQAASSPDSGGGTPVVGDLTGSDPSPETAPTVVGGFQHGDGRAEGRVVSLAYDGTTGNVTDLTYDGLPVVDELSISGLQAEPRTEPASLVLRDARQGANGSAEDLSRLEVHDSASGFVSARVAGGETLTVTFHDRLDLSPRSPKQVAIQGSGYQATMWTHAGSGLAVDGSTVTVSPESVSDVWIQVSGPDPLADLIVQAATSGNLTVHASVEEDRALAAEYDSVTAEPAPADDGADLTLDVPLSPDEGSDAITTPAPVPVLVVTAPSTMDPDPESLSVRLDGRELPPAKGLPLQPEPGEDPTAVALSLDDDRTVVFATVSPGEDRHLQIRSDGQIAILPGAGAVAAAVALAAVALSARRRRR